jgi:hypothetical protein
MSDNLTFLDTIRTPIHLGLVYELKVPVRTIDQAIICFRDIASFQNSFNLAEGGKISFLFLLLKGQILQVVDRLLQHHRL